jgi:putative peptidoglycan lipid II flippase
LNLLRALSTVSGMTLLSRITGLARESLKAAAFGAGLQMDAFEAAFRLPNILRRLFAEGAFSQAFVPIFAEYRRQRGPEETRALVGRVGTLLAVVLLGLSILGVVAAPALVYVLAGGFAQTPGKVELTASMIRIVFLHSFRVACPACRRRAQRIPAICDPGLHAGAAQPVDHRRRDLARPARRPPIVALAWGVRSAVSCSSPCSCARSRRSGCSRFRASIGATKACGVCWRRWDRR